MVFPENIFFNGPFKHKEETPNYLKIGVLVNIDSYDEFKWIESFADKSKIICRIGIRLNFNLIDNPSRFGIDINDLIIQEIIDKSNCQNICHWKVYITIMLKKIFQHGRFVWIDLFHFLDRLILKFIMT